MQYAGARPDPVGCGRNRPAGLGTPARIIRSIELAQDLAPGLTLTQLMVFLAVAGDEGIRLNELGTRIGASEGVTSRNVRSLIQADEPGALRPGHGLLILMQDSRDGRGRRAALSPAGRDLVARIEYALEC